MNENDRPIWTLRKINPFSSDIAVIAYPLTPDTIMDDAIVLISLYAVEDEEVISLFKKQMESKSLNEEIFIELLELSNLGRISKRNNSTITLPTLNIPMQKLYRVIRRRNYWKYHLFITIYNGAPTHAIKGLSSLKRYKISFTIYRKVYSWDRDHEEITETQTDFSTL